MKRKTLRLFSPNDFNWMDEDQLYFGDCFVEHLEMDCDATTTKGHFFAHVQEDDYRSDYRIKKEFNENYSLFLERGFIEEIPGSYSCYQKSDRFSENWKTRRVQKKYKSKDPRYQVIKVILNNIDDNPRFKEICDDLPSISLSDIERALQTLIKDEALEFADEKGWIEGAATIIEPGPNCPTYEYAPEQLKLKSK